MNTPPDAPAWLMSLLPDVSCESFASFEASSSDDRYYPEHRQSLVLQYLSQLANTRHEGRLDSRAPSCEPIA
jgi:hypothetical protein